MSKLICATCWREEEAVKTGQEHKFGEGTANSDSMTHFCMAYIHQPKKTKCTSDFS